MFWTNKATSIQLGVAPCVDPAATDRVADSGGLFPVPARLTGGSVLSRGLGVWPTPVRVAALGVRCAAQIGDVYVRVRRGTGTPTGQPDTCTASTRTCCPPFFPRMFEFGAFFKVELLREDRPTVNLSRCVWRAIYRSCERRHNNYAQAGIVASTARARSQWCCPTHARRARQRHRQVRHQARAPARG